MADSAVKRVVESAVGRATAFSETGLRCRSVVIYFLHYFLDPNKALVTNARGASSVCANDALNFVLAFSTE